MTAVQDANATGGSSNGKEPIHVALAANHRYMPGLLVTMVGMIRFCGQKERLRFHILSEGLTEEDKRRVSEFAAEYGAPPPEFFEPDMASIRNRFVAYKNSHAAFIRLFLCEIYPFDWIIYSDVDTLWTRDPAELWELRDDSASIMWCRDLPSIAAGAREYSVWNPDFDESAYACSGVMLMNLKRLRETGFVAKAAAFVDKWGSPTFPDQDILNYVCRTDAKLLPQHWDCMMPARDAVRGAVLHFNGIGGRFGSSFSGWRPLYYIWFRFYFDFILKEPRRKACGVFKCAAFWLLGSFYPPVRTIRFLFRRRPHLADNIARQMFFAWLWRRAQWKWRGRRSGP